MPTDEAGTIGLWFDLEPFSPLRGEGICQLLVQLLRGAAAKPGQRIVIGCASWSVADLRALAIEYQVPLASIEFLSKDERLPILLAMKHRRDLRRQNRKPKAKKRRWTARMSDGLLSTLAVLHAQCLGGRNVAGLALGTLVVASAWLLLALPLLILLLGSILSSIVRRLTPPKDAAKPGILRSVRAGISRRTKEIRSKGYQWIVAREFDRLSNLARARKDVTVWFVPRPWSQGPVDVQVPIVVALPDAVYLDHPSVHDAAMADVDQKIRKRICSAAAVITYSEHVRIEHVVRRLGVPPNRTHVVRHAAMSVREDLPTGVACSGEGLSEASLRKMLAERIQKHLIDIRPRAAREPGMAIDYLLEFPFDEVDFLFVSSQVRAHKSLRNLLDAVEFLIRRQYRPIKLFVTGRFDHAPETAAFLRSRRLERDVLSVPDLPAEVHAAFYRLAKLTVVPSLFEGGFPFPFTESLSVDTPVILSNMPCTRELLAPEVHEPILFDPYSTKSIVARLNWALDHRETLLNIERPIYAQMAQRTWPIVAAEYLEIFERTARAAQTGGSAESPPAWHVGNKRKSGSTAHR